MVVPSTGTGAPWTKLATGLFCPLPLSLVHLGFASDWAAERGSSPPVACPGSLPFPRSWSFDREVARLSAHQGGR